MPPMFRTIYTLVVLLTLVYKSSAIHCYYCNSANNSACLDVNKYEDEIRSKIIPIVHCETAIPSPVALNFFCRKIVQTIFHSNRDSEVRVTRGCGWIRHEKACYKDDNSDHLGTTCQCTQDLCNGGDSTHPVTATRIFLLATVLCLLR